MTSASAVTVVPVSSFPVADPLTGTEIVPIVQGGASKQTTVADIAAATADVGEETLQGRAKNAGTGPIQTLTANEGGEIIYDVIEDFRYIAGDGGIGWLTVPPSGISTRAAVGDDCSRGLLQTTAASSTYTLPNANIGNFSGFVVTLACIDAGGAIIIDPAAGATLIDLRDGSTGTKTITGVGVATVWQIQASPAVYLINGSANLA